MSMKKITASLLCALLILAAMGCGNNNTDVKEYANQAVADTEVTTSMADNVANVTDNATAVTDNTSSLGVEDTLKEFKPIATGADGIDIDLTTLSATMVYSQVYNMMIAPEDYVGKMVKMQGMMASYYDEAADKRYFACIIQDATACCAQGIEFELEGDYKYPDDYPSDGETICVEGIFETYDEAGNTYVTLRKARLL
jgi:hypothetical protein